MKKLHKNIVLWNQNEHVEPSRLFNLLCLNDYIFIDIFVNKYW